MAMTVYWIHHPEHTDMFTQGYIGITARFVRRMFEHKALTTNKYLSNAIKKYGWDNLVKEVILVADKEYCVDVETKLRSRIVKYKWSLDRAFTEGNTPEPASE